MARATPYNIPPQEQKTSEQVWAETASLGKAAAGGALKGTGDVVGFIPRAANLAGGYAGLVDGSQFLENEQNIANAINWTPDALGLRPDMEANPNAAAVGEIAAPIPPIFKAARAVKRKYDATMNPINKNIVMEGTGRGTDTVQAASDQDTPIYEPFQKTPENWERPINVPTREEIAANKGFRTPEEMSFRDLPAEHQVRLSHLGMQKDIAAEEAKIMQDMREIDAMERMAIRNNSPQPPPVYARGYLQSRGVPGTGRRVENSYRNDVVPEDRLSLSSEVGNRYSATPAPAQSPKLGNNSSVEDLDLSISERNRDNMLLQQFNDRTYGPVVQNKI